MVAGFVCAWCRKPGAVRRVAIDTDGSVEGYRYFCDASHQANFETNQPRPALDGSRFIPRAAGFFEIVKDANLDGWQVLNCFQMGKRDQLYWRVNLQLRKANGATETVFTEYADDPDPRLAMLAAIGSARARWKDVDRTEPVAHDTTQASGQPSGMDKRVAKALDALWFAVKTSGSRGRHRTDDM